MIGLVDPKKMSVIPDLNLSQEVKDLTAKVRQDYQLAYEIQHLPFREFNDMSVLDRDQHDQKRFNNYIPPQSQDPEESWHYNGTRPLVRSKIISIAAHATSSILYPDWFAQNEFNEEDKMAAQVMHDLIEYHVRNSDYEMSFLYGVIQSLVSPCAYLEAKYSENIQTIKQRLDSGETVTKEILDEVFSGLNVNTIPVDEVLITNVREFDHQKQRAVIRKEYIDYTEAQGLYGNHPNFKAVSPGTQALYNEEDGQFYEQKDESVDDTLVEKVIYKNRTEDTEVPYINGVYLGEDDVDNNMMKHRRPELDVNGEPIQVPRYSEVKFGYSPLDEKRFYYYKSAANDLGPDNDLVDRMWKNVVDGTFLSVMPPTFSSGDDQIDTSVIIPGAHTNISEGGEIQPINIGQNLQAGYAAIERAEQSMSEITQDNFRGGTPSQNIETAFEFSRLEQNTQIKFSIFGKQIGQAVVELGENMKDLIITHQTVSESEQILGGVPRLKFRQFLLPGQTENGREVTKVIRFSERLLGREMTDEEKEIIERQLFEEAGKEKIIYEINPYLFGRFKFMAMANPDNLLPKNKAFEKAMNLEAYDRMIADPFTNKRQVSNDFLVRTFADGNTEKYMMSESEVQQQQEAAQQGANAPRGNGDTSRLVEQMNGENSLSELIRT